MATPKGAQGISTPKNPLTSTPNRPAASPRPLTGTFANKTLSYKSPAVKTPASLQGHSHRISISSQPISTPLAAPAIHDELLNLNSPAAALIASLGNTGLTPMATGQDGLGITTGITPQPVRDAALPPKNPETERLNRLEQVVKLLKSKIAGHGITREGVERIAQIQGFTILWDEENLTIAGNSVDLEIIFNSFERDTVRDVQLRLNTSGSEEPQLQKDASEVLKRHLMVSGDASSPNEAWRSLKSLSLDLEYLSQLDYVSSSVNCFELIGGLYTTFRRIWDEEKRRMRDRAELSHICQSNIGQPSIDGGNRLGITSRYWVNRESYKNISAQTQSTTSDQDESWVATFSCEKGNPGINSNGNNNWLEDEVLKTTVTTEDMFQESQIDKPNWSSLTAPKSLDEQPKDASVMMLEGREDGATRTLDLLFTCRFEPAVLIPVNVLARLNNLYPMVSIDQSKALTYQQAILNRSRSTTVREWNPSVRWSKSFSSYGNEDSLGSKEHSYSLYSNGIPWSYSVESLKFSHPEQYADALPVLRQYALLWSILSNTLGDGAVPDDGSLNNPTAQDSSRSSRKPTVKKRSNKGTAQNRLEDILSSGPGHQAIPRIDMSLDLVADASKAKLVVIVPMPSAVAKKQGSPFVHVVIEIRRNGHLEIVAITGPRFMDEEKLKRKATKVLSLSEDVSVLVQWLLEEVQKAA